MSHVSKPAGTTADRGKAAGSIAKKALVLAALFAGGNVLLADAAAAQTGEPPAHWDGFYVGAHGAYHLGETIDDGGCVGLCARDHQIREPYLALQAGYDGRVGENVVLGIMGWVGVTPVKSEARLSATVVVRGETDFAGFIGVRAGLDAGPWLPYAFVGYEHVTGTVTNDSAPIREVEGEHGGLGLGVGAEFRLARHWSVDARYMYSDLGADSYNFGGGTTTTGEQAHTFSFGVNYRF